MKPIKARQFIEELLRRGRYTFAAEEARQAIKGSKVSTYWALYRLAKAGWLVSPKAGFYIIVDPQHRSMQSLPPEWFIHDLMKYLGKPYYVGLLSAAQIHGAAHQIRRSFKWLFRAKSARFDPSVSAVAEFTSSAKGSSIKQEWSMSKHQPAS